MASVVDGRSRVAGKLKESGQRLLTTQVHLGLVPIDTHIVIWLHAEQWAY